MYTDFVIFSRVARLGYSLISFALNYWKHVTVGNRMREYIGVEFDRKYQVLCAVTLSDTQDTQFNIIASCTSIYLVASLVGNATCFAVRKPMVCVVCQY